MQSTNGGDDLAQHQQQQQQQWLAMQHFQQQQWLAMQQNPAAAAMHHQMMYQQPQYVPYPYQQQQQQPRQYQQPQQQKQQQKQGKIQTTSEENKANILALSGIPCCVGGVSRTTGADEPAHYILKIESFSVLSRAGIEEYESEVFQAGDYKWRLLLYPNGNEKEDGQNHISLYLVLADTTDFPTGWNVHVYFKFFVYDHARMNYLIIQVADGKKTQFHTMKTKSGFAKLLSLDWFKDSSNGYLYNDSCVFGAEVFVTPKCAEMETCLSMIEPPSWNNTYSWIIDKFSTLQNDKLISEEFKVGKLKWKLSLYMIFQKLSIFLAVSDCSSFPLGWRFYAKFKLRVKDQVGGNHIEKEESHWFCDSNEYCGFPGFMLLSELKEGLLVNDNIIIEVEISAVGTIRNST